MDTRDREGDVESINDELAREHPIDDYYERSPWPIRYVESKRLAIIREFMGEVDGLDVLEVGSGGGHVLRMFPSARLTALDVSSVYLESARRNLSGLDVRFVKGEVEKTDWRGQQFDRVICTEVLEHTIDPDAILGAIARLLRPSGVAVITVPNDPLILRVKIALRHVRPRRLVQRFEWGGDRYHVHSWTPGEFESLLSRHVRIVARRMAPFSAVPLRACFKCTAKVNLVST